MAKGNLHLIKLCVGVEFPEELEAWQAKRRKQLGRANPIHITRMWPRREGELLQGGSIYWVMKGEIKARQEILRLDEIIGEDGIKRCGIVLAENVVRTSRVRRRAFQGWRYLDAAQAPEDLKQKVIDEPLLPHDLENALLDIGVR